MKTIKLILLLFISTLLLTSCSDDEGPTEEALSITLSSSKTTYDFGEYVFFSVKTNTNGDVSSISEIKLNDEVVSHQFVSDNAGTFTAVATYDGVTSNEISITINEPPAVVSLELTTDASSLLVGEQFTFTVAATYDNGEVIDKTEGSTYFIDNAAIDANTYSIDTPGNYVVKATYDGVASNEITVEVEALGSRYQKYAVIEDYTGAWCGWCPRVAYGIEQVEAATNFSIPVAIHNGDTMSNSFTSQMESSFSITGFPTAYLDRDVTWAYPEPSNVNQVVNLTSDPSRVGLALDASLSGSTLNLDIDAKFGENFSNENIYLTVFLLEDDLIESQTNYTTYYGGGSTLSNFEHDHVLRHSLTNVTGDLIASDQTTKEHLFETNYSIEVPSVISDNTKISFVVMITRQDKSVINARFVHINDSNSLEVQ